MKRHATRMLRKEQVNIYRFCRVRVQLIATGYIYIIRLIVLKSLTDRIINKQPIVTISATLITVDLLLILLMLIVFYGKITNIFSYIVKTIPPLKHNLPNLGVAPFQKVKRPSSLKILTKQLRVDR